MKTLFLIIFLTCGVNAFADEIQAVDATTYKVIQDVPAAEFKNISEVEAQIKTLQIHKAKVEAEEETYAALVIEDETQIEALQKELNDAQGAIKAAKLDVQEVAPVADGINWSTNP